MSYFVKTACLALVFVVLVIWVVGPAAQTKEPLESTWTSTDDAKWLATLWAVQALWAVQTKEPLESTWTSTPPTIDGTITESDAWSDGELRGIPYGDLWVLNDHDYLYLLVDLFCDTGNDYGMDFCSAWLRTSPSEGSSLEGVLCLQDSGVMRKYGDTSSPVSLEQSHVATGFGPSIMPGFESAKHRIPHRLLEMKVSLSELGASPGNLVDIDLVVSSKTPPWHYGEEGFIQPIVIKLAEIPYVVGKVLVSFKEEISPAEIRDFQEEFQLEEIDYWELFGVYRCAILSDVTAPEMVEVLSKDPRVEHAKLWRISMISGRLCAEPDWIETAFLLETSPEYRSTQAVGLLWKLGEEDFAFATGFLVSPDLLLTANHFVSTQEEAQATSVIFNAERGNTLDEYEEYKVAELVYTWPTWDVSLLRCQPGPVGSEEPILPGERWGYLSLADTPLARGNPVYLIHQCDAPYATSPYANPYFKKISFGVIDDPTYGTRQATHDADTANGSSGAPLLDPSNHTVIALHRGYLGGTRNVAIRIDRFIEELKEAGLWTKLSHPDQ